MAYGAQSYNTRSHRATIEGDAFRCQFKITIAANASHWYKVTIPTDAVIATVNRIWISDLGGCTLTVFALPTGGTLGTQFANRNFNGRSSKTSQVIITPYTAAPTVSDANIGDEDLIPSGGSGNKSAGAYNPQTSFRVYAPGDYAIRITNNNTSASCPTIIEYNWLEVATLESLR